MQIDGFYYEPNDLAKSLGVKDEKSVGVSAQEINKILPEVIASSPISEEYLTVKYERLIPLLIEAIKEQQHKIEYLEQKILNSL